MVTRISLLIALVLFAAATAAAESASSPEMQVYVLMGQSNMAGRGKLATDRQPIHPRVRMLNYENQWEPAIEPLHRDNARLAGAGLGASFAQTMADAQPNVTIGLAPCAVGGTPLSRWEKGGDLYQRALKRIREAEKTGKIAGVLWHQGETDALDASLTSTYGDRLARMIADMRSDLSSPQLPFVLGKLGEFSLDERKGKKNLWQAINRQIDSLASGDSHIAAADSSGLSDQGDAVHFNADSLRTFGKRYAGAMLQLKARENAECELERLLPLTADSQAAIERASQSGLLEIAPTHLPRVAGSDCNHLGGPIAAMENGTIVLMHRRIPGHNRNGAGLPDPTISYGVVLRSEDGGKTWSEPYDLRDCMTPENRERGGLVPLSHRAKFDPDNRSPLGFKVHLHSIGTTRDGAIIAVNNHGVFRSDDAGKSWKHFPEALREDTFGHEIVNIGPRVIDDPELGLLVFGNWFGEVDRYHALRKSLVVLNSQDGGATWKANAMPVGFPQYEPAAISFDGEYRLVTRDQTKVLAHKQLTWKPGGKPQVIDTNLRDPRLVDTVDLSLNPVTKRLEIIRSERHHMELWIWSIDPRDWDQGEWTRECRLLKTSGKFYADTDGFHPAGAVIDQKQGVQHIFVYSGHPNGPAGVFRITRTLDTPQLKAALSGAK